MSFLRTTLPAALLIALLSVGSLAHAASLPAGFPPGSLWLSKTAAASGDVLTIYTVVYNASGQQVSGDVAFSIDSAALATKHFDADPGTTQIVSQTWTAITGTHTFSAKIENASASGIASSTALASLAASTASVTVAPPPPPPKAVTDTLQTADAAQGVIASTTPIIQNIASTTYATTEGIRTAGLAGLQKLADAAAPKTAGKVLGVSDYQAQGTSSALQAASAGSGIGGFLAGTWRAILAVLIAIFSSQLWFYILLLVVLFIVYKVFRTVLSERKYSRD